MNKTDGKTAAELLALSQILGEMIANDIITRVDHADGIHYYLYLGTRAYEVNIDVTAS